LIGTLMGAKGQAVVRSGTGGLEVGDEGSGIVFELPDAEGKTEVSLQTLGGAMHVGIGASGETTLGGGPATSFHRVPVGDGFALGTPDGRTWLSVAGDGALVLAAVTSPGVCETFTVQPSLQTHKRCCCGPSQPLPSAAAWDDIGHMTIVNQGIACLRDPWSPTPESVKFLKIWDELQSHQSELWTGLREADYRSDLNDTWGGVPYYVSHFFDAASGKNYWGQYQPGNPGQTARDRGCHYFRASVTAYCSDSVIPGTGETPLEGLGIALHYLTDLTQPMHAANIPNIFGDHEDWPLLDWRHSKWEDYAESVARSGTLFVGYPRLTVAEMSIDDFTYLEELFDLVSRMSKKVWEADVKPIYDTKGYSEAWGDEAATALTHATHNAPVFVAKLLSWWAREVTVGGR
jgi:hypothetical protein